jgi:hypothetical protein
MKLLLPFILVVFAVSAFSATRQELRPRPLVLAALCLGVTGGLMMRRFV